MSESRRRRRRRRIVMALAIGSGVWFVRSRLGSRDTFDPWPVRPSVSTPPGEPAPAGPAVDAPAPESPEPVVVEPVPATTNGANGTNGATNGATNGNGSGARLAAVDDAVDAPYGPGSARSLPDGSAPGPEYTIKGNTTSKLFHPPTSPYFARTKAQVWFRTAEDATAAGFTAWTPRKRAAKA